MNGSNPIKVSVVEDNRQIRESLTILINGGGFRCVSAHKDAEDACKAIPAQTPDVVLMDIQLPGMSGIECVQKLKGSLPSLKILMHTVYEDRGKIFKALRAGANGYLLKDTPPAKLLEALREVHNGYSPMSGEIARMVVEYFHSRANDDIERLTDREHEVLLFLTKGYRNKEIADTLSVGIDTIRAHLRSIYHKLHVNSRTEAVVKYLER